MSHLVDLVLFYLEQSSNFAQSLSYYHWSFSSKMASMDSTAAPAPPSEAQITPSEMEVTKRDAANDVSGGEGPPAKKARLDENQANAEEDPRSKGIAPIKAEYACPAFLPFCRRLTLVTLLDI